MNILKRIQLFAEDYTMLWLRDPVTQLLGLVFVVAGVWLSHSQSRYGDVVADYEYRLLFWAVIGFPYTLAIRRIFAHAQRDSSISIIWQFITQLGLLSILALYFVLLPTPYTVLPSMYYMQIGMMFVVGIGAMLLIPYIFQLRQSDKEESFWSHFLHSIDGFVLAGIIGTLFYISLALAISAVDQLFFDLPDELFPDAFFIVAGVICLPIFSMYVLEVQTTQKTLEWLRDVVAKFVLIPVSIGYMLILYAYIAKLFITQSWPETGIDWWILAFTIVAILSYLYFVKRAEGKTISLAMRFFALTTIPPIAVFVWSISRRISEHGLNDWRYLAFVYAAWITGTVAYMIISKQKDRRYVMLAFVGLIALSGIGPWSSSNISKYVELSRLDTELREANLLTESGVINKEAAAKTDGETANAIFQHVDYLVSYHGAEVLQKYMNQPVAELDVPIALGGLRRINAYDIYSIGLGFNDTYAYNSSSYYEDNYRNTYAVYTRGLAGDSNEYADITIIPTSSYEYSLTDLSVFVSEGAVRYNIAINEADYTLRFDFTKKILTVKNKSTNEEIFNESIAEWIESLKAISSGTDITNEVDFMIETDDFTMQLSVVSITSFDDELDTIQIRPFLNLQ